MGWLSSIFGAEQPADPLGKIDPKLREFLEKESPVKYRPNQPTTSETRRNDDPKIAKPEADKLKTDEPVVPTASLYQDGRYAHLWKSYRPLAQVEAEVATDHDKLMNVLEAFKERKVEIGRAGLENCAQQQEEWINCMKNGSWEDQLQMCRHQVRRFERCYTMQSRFLRALGYGSVLGRPAQVDEDIQMHADSLYQRMLKHEEAVEQAKRDGTPMPVFEAVIPKANTSTVSPTEGLEKKWKEKLDKLPESERAVEEAALRADLQAKSEVAMGVKKLWEEQKGGRDARRTEGQATIWDSVNALFGRGEK